MNTINKKVLIGIHDRSQKIKIELINAAVEQKLFLGKMANISSTYENMQKDLKKLYNLQFDTNETNLFTLNWILI